MKKFIGLLLVAGMIIFMTGCNFYMKVTYPVADNIELEVKLIASDGYQITTSMPFEIKQNGEVLTRGKIISEEEYQQYLDGVRENEEVTIIEDDDNCIFYNYGEEYNHVFRIMNTEVYLILSNTVSEESAREVLDRLSFTVTRKIM